MTIRISANVAAHPCQFRKSCIGSCEWCQTHSYSEACVPMLQKRIENLEVELSVEEEVGKSIQRRLQHLLKSKLIQSFDEKDISQNAECGIGFPYKRDILEADKYLEALDMIERIKKTVPKSCKTCGLSHSESVVCAQCSYLSNWKAWWE